MCCIHNSLLLAAVGFHNQDMATNSMPIPSLLTQQLASRKTKREKRTDLVHCFLAAQLGGSFHPNFPSGTPNAQVFSWSLTTRKIPTKSQRFFCFSLWYLYLVTLKKRSSSARRNLRRIGRLESPRSPPAAAVPSNHVHLPQRLLLGVERGNWRGGEGRGGCRFRQDLPLPCGSGRRTPLRRESTDHGPLISVEYSGIRTFSDVLRSSGPLHGGPSALQGGPWALVAQFRPDDSHPLLQGRFGLYRLG